MANVQIYQLDGVSSNLDNSALLACDITNPDASERATTPKVTRNLSVAELETQMLQTDEYTTALDTTSKSITGAINELKTDKQDEIIPVVLNNNLTYHSNCSIQNGFIIRYGRIIEVGMILKATGNINNNDIIVSGLPRALQNRRCPRGLGTDQWYANTDYTSGGLAVDIDENDQTKAIIRNFSNITASSSSPKYIYMSFSYVTMN